MILNFKSYFNDIRRFANVFKGKPVVNYLKILLAFYMSRFTGKVFTGPYPFAYSAEVSARCNLNCPECMVGMGKIIRKKGYLDSSVFKKLLNESSRQSFYINLYFQGEPFLNQNIFEYILKAKAKKFYTVISTNAHFLNEENNKKIINSKLDRLLVSVDGITHKTYTCYRKNGQFDKVISGIKSLAQQKKVMKASHPLIVLQFLVHRKNEHELRHLKNFAKNIGVDIIQIKTMQFDSQESLEKFLPLKEKYRRYKKDDDGIWQVKVRRRGGCFRIWGQVVVTSDGNVVPCCYDKIPEHVLGNISEQTLAEIWKSEKFDLIRKSLLSNKHTPVICQNCYY